MTVTLIANPPFQVNFQAYNPSLSPVRSSLQKVSDVASKVFAIMKIVGLSAYQTVRTNISTVLTSFQHIVLGVSRGRFNPPTSLTILAFRVAVWAGFFMLGFIFSTISTVRQNLIALPSQLASYLPNSIDGRHLVAKSTAIDMHNVPAAITVDKILELYNEINFTNPQAPGYMPPSTRQESYGSNVVNFDVYSLRGHLTTFVNHVNDRDAFLGTPPSYMMAQLMKFYQKIEDATRFNINKVVSEYDEFMLQHIGQNITKEHPDYNRYNELLQAKARLAIDMAIAGAHCGARYMGDAMDAYLANQGDLAANNQGLQAKLFYLLGKSRETIARGQIQEHLGFDTHAFSKYMANLGTLLGIPGTEDIVEYLTGNRFDRDRFLRLFFEAYTPDHIRDEVQKEIKRSQEFREAVFDWLKDRSKDWKKDEYKALVEKIVSEIKPVEVSTTFTKVGYFIVMLHGLKKTGRLDLKDLEKWDDFLTELFVLPYSKELIPNPLDRHNLKSLLLNAQLVSQLQGLVQAIANGQELNLEEVKKISNTMDKAGAVKQAIIKNNLPPIDMDVLYRAVESNANLTTIIQDHVDHQRNAEFLEAITRSDEFPDEDPAITVTQHGLRQEVLNWILYENQVLKPVS